MIAGRYSSHIGTNGFNNARTFVAGNPGITAVGHVASDEVLIGVAKS